MVPVSFYLQTIHLKCWWITHMIHSEASGRPWPPPDVTAEPRCAVRRVVARSGAQSRLIARRFLSADVSAAALHVRTSGAGGAAARSQLHNDMTMRQPRRLAPLTQTRSRAHRHLQRPASWPRHGHGAQTRPTTGTYSQPARQWASGTRGRPSPFPHDITTERLHIATGGGTWLRLTYRRPQHTGAAGPVREGGSAVRRCRQPVSVTRRQRAAAAAALSTAAVRNMGQRRPDRIARQVPAGQTCGSSRGVTVTEYQQTHWGRSELLSTSLFDAAHD